MRRSFFAVCCIGVTLISSPVIAQKASGSQRAVLALEEEWTRALVKGDTGAFRRLTVPGFIYTEDNAVMTQSELIRAIATSTDKVTWAGNEGMKFHDYTPTSIVTGILVVKGKDSRGHPFTRRYRYTDTWLYRNGKWQAIAAQDYLIPK